MIWKTHVLPLISLLIVHSNSLIVIDIFRFLHFFWVTFLEKDLLYIHFQIYLHKFIYNFTCDFQIQTLFLIMLSFLFLIILLVPSLSHFLPSSLLTLLFFFFNPFFLESLKKILAFDSLLSTVAFFLFHWFLLISIISFCNILFLGLVCYSLYSSLN